MLAAGGRGERTGSPVPKQFVSLAGRPVFSWALQRLLDVGCERVVIAAPADRTEWLREQVASVRGVDVVEGGAVRQASVAAGLDVIRTPVVLVHDAARPFIEEEVVDALLAALRDRDAAIPVIPVGETLKEARSGVIRRTIDRSTLVLSQTPQAFHTETLRAAHERARSEGYESTDDAELIERYGGRVATVAGTRRNIKITYPEDLSLAEAMMRS
ncbi:MAG: 2-C-methyl-D-erythritol 4-phosphate cytidylyltransferase [Actinomycetota bacterium]|nr:2-C-methyl-D-erythritol 4-phosphate cytidylyltransferase [Actinomycetota bacterium]